ncbi:hypothetical protein [Leuconostoc gelidum]|nr:hypothetical protein [Leuconostoc gelidum]
MATKNNRIINHNLASLQHVFVSSVWLDLIYAASKPIIKFFN